MRYHYDKNTKQWKILHLAIRTSKKSSIIKIVSPLAKNLSKTPLRFGPDGKVRSHNGELHQESNVHLEQTPISTKESPKKSTAPKENFPSRVRKHKFKQNFMLVYQMQYYTCEF